MTPSLWIELGFFVILASAYAIAGIVLLYYDVKPEIDAYLWLAEMDELADAERKKRA